MDKQETGELLNIIKALYPFFLKDGNPELVFNLWHDGLKDCEYMAVMENLKRHSRINRYAPTISDLIIVDSKYPGHQAAGSTLEKVEQFKNERVDPPKFDIRKHLRG